MNIISRILAFFGLLFFMYIFSLFYIGMYVNAAIVIYALWKLTE